MSDLLDPHASIGGKNMSWSQKALFSLAVLGIAALGAVFMCSPRGERRTFSSLTGVEARTPSAAPSLSAGDDRRGTGESQGGAAAPETLLLARMGIFAVAPGVRAQAAQVESDGRFTLALRLPPEVCSQPIAVTLETEKGTALGGKRSTQSVQLEPADPAAEERYVGAASFQVSDRCLVKGTVTDPAHAPLRDVTVALVMLSTSDDTCQVLRESKSDEDGRFSIEAPLLPEVLLAVVRRERRPEVRHVSTLNGGDVDVGTVELGLGEVIQGRVTWNEAERAHAGLQVQAYRVPKRVILLDSDFLLSPVGERLEHFLVSAKVEDGRFVLPGLEPGAYSLDLGGRDSSCRLPALQDASTKVTAPAEVELDPKDPQLWFVVRDERSATPVFASLRMVGAFGEFRCHTDRKGIGLVVVGPETDYQVFVEAPGYERAALDLRSPAVNGFLEQAVRLKRMPTGNLRLDLGQSWSGHGRVSLQLTGDDHVATQDADVVAGRVEIAALLPGFYDGKLDLWGAGELRGGDSNGDLHLTFTCRVKAEEMVELRVPVR